MIFTMTVTFPMTPNTTMAIWKTRRRMANSFGGSLPETWVELFDILLYAPEINRISKVRLTNHWEQVSLHRLKKRERTSQWRLWKREDKMLRQLLQRKRHFYGAFSHDVTAAILVFQNKETAAMLVYQTKPLEIELHFHANFPYVLWNEHGRWSREWKRSVEFCLRLCDHSKLVTFSVRDGRSVGPFIWLSLLVFIQSQRIKDSQLDVAGKFENFTSSSQINK